MKYNTAARRRSSGFTDIQAAAVALFALSVGMLVVGWMEIQERKDKFEHCLFLELPDKGLAVVQKCARKARYFPTNYGQLVDPTTKE